MKRDTPRILVIGAGVNGSICATRLYTAGFDVTVLARSTADLRLLVDGKPVPARSRSLRPSSACTSGSASC